MRGIIHAGREWKRPMVRDLLRRFSKRMRRAIKRRMKGESRRQWIERNLHDSEVGIMLDVVHCLVSMIMVISMIKLNWRHPVTNFGSNYLAIDMVNLIATIADLGLRLYSASNRKSFLLHWLSVIEMTCVLPFLVELTTSATAAMSSTYTFRLLMMLRIMRLLQFYRLLRLAKSAKLRQGLLICLTTLCIILCAATFMQTIEYCDPMYKEAQVLGGNCQDMTFLDAIYFVCITITTVGFGDVAPKTNLGKAFDVGLIFFAGGLIPLQISGYSDILSRETAFDKKYQPDRSTQHVLLCGEVENGALLFFLHNWLHKEEERRTRRKVVILAPNLPSNDLRRVLLHPDYEQRVIYLQGSAMVAADLQRAAAPTAEFCFVMVKKHSGRLDQNDTAANLITCSVRKNNRHAPLHVQVSKFDNTRHFHISGATAVICLEQLKLAFFGKCLWIRGLNPFLGNLIQKYSHIEECRGYWLSDYLLGCEQKICEGVLPAFLLTMVSYRALAVLFYREFGVPVVGVRTIEDTATIYPVDEQLAGADFRSVFFIGRGNDVASKLEKLTPAVFARHPDIAPASMGMNDNRNSRSVATILSAAIENKRAFGRRVSIGFSRDHRASTSLEKTLVRTNTIRLSGKSFLESVFTSRPLDKITPVDREEDETGAPENGGEDDTIVNLPPGKSIDGRQTNHLPLATASVPKPMSLKPVIPLVALSHAKLVESATPSRSEPREAVLRPDFSGILSSATSAKHARSIRERGTQGNDVKNIPSSEKYLFHQSSNLSPDSTQSSRVENLIVREEDKNEEIPSTPRSENTPIENPPPFNTLLARKVSEQSTEEEDGCHAANWEPAPLVRPSIANSGNLRARVRQMSLCFRRDAPPTTMSDHYVVCGIPSNYEDFLANLSDLNEEITGVIFITQRTLLEKDFRAHHLHERLYFVHGSPLSMHIFHTARMLHARSILIMSYCGMENNSSMDVENDHENADENMADVDAITTHRFISEALQNEASRLLLNRTDETRPTPFIVAEMIRPSNVKFLIDRNGSLFDAKAAANEPRQRDLLKDVKLLDSSFLSPLYASGHIYFSNVMDALMGSCANQQLMIEMVTQLVISGNMSMKMPNRVQKSRHRLSQMPAPERYHFRPYALLVEGLLQNEDTMTLGIYRSASTSFSPQHVLTNPPGDELVSPHDLLFVIK